MARKATTPYTEYAALTSHCLRFDGSVATDQHVLCPGK